MLLECGVVVVYNHLLCYLGCYVRKFKCDLLDCKEGVVHGLLLGIWSYMLQSVLLWGLIKLKILY